MNFNDALKALAPGGLGGLATQISAAVNGSGSGTPGGTSATASGALNGGMAAPSPAVPSPASHWYTNPMLLVAVAIVGAVFFIKALVRR